MQIVSKWCVNIRVDGFSMIHRLVFLFESLFLFIWLQHMWWAVSMNGIHFRLCWDLDTKKDIATYPLIKYFKIGYSNIPLGISFTFIINYPKRKLNYVLFAWFKINSKSGTAYDVPTRKMTDPSLLDLQGKKNISPFMFTAHWYEITNHKFKIIIVFNR